MTVSNEDDGVPVVYDLLDNGLQYMSELSHVAYCTGPFQFAFLLGALDICEIPPYQCTILPVRGATKNNDLKQTLATVCSYLGIQTADFEPMPLPTLRNIRYLCDRAFSKPPVVYWYGQGTPYSPSALYRMRKIMPEMAFEYYDGLGSHSAAFEQERTRLALPSAHGFDDLRELAVQRLMSPDMHIMPGDGLWQRYAPQHSQAKTRYVPLSVMLHKIRLLGEILDDISGDPWHLGDDPTIILLPTRFSELRYPVSSDSFVENELRMHDDVLGIVRSISKTVSILVKAHPKTGLETVRRLEEICAKHNARLYYRQQLVEYILDKSRRRDMLVIGLEPSTSLLNTMIFGWGRSVCLGKYFIESYLGHHDRDERSLTGVDLLSESGVTVIDSLADLLEFVREQVPR